MPLNENHVAVSWSLTVLAVCHSIFCDFQQST